MDMLLNQYEDMYVDYIPRFGLQPIASAISSLYTRKSACGTPLKLYNLRCLDSLMFLFTQSVITPWSGRHAAPWLQRRT